MKLLKLQDSDLKILLTSLYASHIENLINEKDYIRLFNKIENLLEERSK